MCGGACLLWHILPFHLTYQYALRAFKLERCNGDLPKRVKTDVLQCVRACEWGTAQLSGLKQGGGEVIDKEGWNRGHAEQASLRRGDKNTLLKLNLSNSLFCCPNTRAMPLRVILRPTGSALYGTDQTSR